MESSIVKSAIKDMHPGRTAEVLLNGEVIGFVGQVHPTVQKNYGYEGNLCI